MLEYARSRFLVGNEVWRGFAVRVHASHFASFPRFPLQKAPEWVAWFRESELKHGRAGKTN